MLFLWYITPLVISKLHVPTFIIKKSSVNYMKKQLLFFISFFLFALVSCSDSNSSLKEISNPPSFIDLRNKSFSEKSMSKKSIGSNIGIGCYIGKDNNSKCFGILSNEDLKSIVSFEDDKIGFKINYNTPKKLEEYSLITRIVYIDGNGKWSTRQNINYAAINEFNIDTGSYVVKSQYSWVYPFVLANKTYKFAIQFQYSKEKISNPPDFQLYYEITPLHGIGIIDDLPYNWNSSDYVSIKDALVSINNVIPVESSNGVFKSIGLFGTHSNNTYWNEFSWIGGYDEKIEDEENSSTTIDMSEKNYYIIR